MVVAMTVVGMVEMTADKIILVIPVRNTFMSTGGTVHVTGVVSFALVIGCAGVWIEIANR
jgi:hypothetical protein